MLAHGLRNKPVPPSAVTGFPRLRTAAPHPAVLDPHPAPSLGREPLDPILVIPDLVAEVSADTAIDRGAWRHPVRFVRPRLDVTVADVPMFGEGMQPSSG
ncbi:hypothetical protein ABZU86_16725 [Streptomyces sp. NPDC005271]|uniref:hypothetical protein n=1 Tax=unclassified Streptomyces TaxID=2593676 RepID=UPI0033AFE6A8